MQPLTVIGIVGAPNVGKSALVNTLLNGNYAPVSLVPGTQSKATYTNFALTIHEISDKKIKAGRQLYMEQLVMCDYVLYVLRPETLTLNKRRQYILDYLKRTNPLLRVVVTAADTASNTELNILAAMFREKTGIIPYRFSANSPNLCDNLGLWHPHKLNAFPELTPKVLADLVSMLECIYRGSADVIISDISKLNNERLGSAITHISSILNSCANNPRDVESVCKTVLTVHTQVYPLSVYREQNECRSALLFGLCIKNPVTYMYFEPYISWYETVYLYVMGYITERQFQARLDVILPDSPTCSTYKNTPNAICCINRYRRMWYSYRKSISRALTLEWNCDKLTHKNQVGLMAAFLLTPRTTRNWCYIQDVILPEWVEKNLRAINTSGKLQPDNTLDHVNAYLGSLSPEYADKTANTGLWNVAIKPCKSVGGCIGSDGVSLRVKDYIATKGKGTLA